MYAGKNTVVMVLTTKTVAYKQQLDLNNRDRVKPLK